jgi:hypothetical protein
MTKDAFIKEVAQLLAGLQVPISLKLPLGAAAPAWTQLHRGLYGFGWASADDYEARINEVLEP